MEKKVTEYIYTYLDNLGEGPGLLRVGGVGAHLAQARLRREPFERHGFVSFESENKQKC